MIQFGPISIDAVALGSQGNAVLGIRDSGKTYTATLLAEGLFDAGIPFIAFDPIGVWRFLRVPGAGRGYPVVVAGGQDGDLPLSPETAPAIVEAAMANGVSLVIDLFDINLSKADWRRIVTASLQVLLHKNAAHGLRHVFVEEAAEFAPQKVGPESGRVYAEVEKLARMGGNARLGYTLINQRAEEVNKAVLELCDNLFLHRQKGRHSLTALSRWLDVGNVVGAKQIVSTLSTLPTGECWAWLQGSDTPVHAKVPAKNSLHPDRRVMRGDDGQAPAAAPVDAGVFVETMKQALAGQIATAAAEDPAALRAENAQLRSELLAAKNLVPVPFNEEEIEAADRRGRERGLSEGWSYGYVAGEQAMLNRVTAALDTLSIDEPPPVPGLSSAPAPAPVASNPGPKINTPLQVVPAPQPKATAPTGKISKAVREIIAFYEAVHPRAVDFHAAAKQAGVGLKSSQFRSYEPELKATGAVEDLGGSRYRAKVAVGSPAEYLNRLAVQLSPKHRAVLEFIRAAGVPVTRDQIVDACGISPTSSTTTAALSILIGDAEIVERVGDAFQIVEALR